MKFPEKVSFSDSGYISPGNVESFKVQKMTDWVFHLS